MQRISVVIISLNEERDIARCLRSVKRIADEIVVVDSFSTDSTGVICKSLGANFIEHGFRSYIEQKNFALTCAKYDKILSLDADEELSEELINSILEVKKEFARDGYSMNRLTRIGDKWINHSGWYPDTKLRLFDRNKGEWAGLNPHDEFRYYDKASVQRLDGNLLHHSFYSFEELEKQTDRFAKLGARAYYEKGKKAAVAKVALKPSMRFARDYFFNGGFLHGKIGFKVCINNARSTYLKYKYLHQLWTKAKS
ncbi:MAG: glycosyltransferase family 2 protein [Chlorobi bacterium]|nr:glycosyltransferase family 2 protein [Chlorobiota bacterium]